MNSHLGSNEPRHALPAHWMALSLLCLATAAIYGHTLDVPLVFDDVANIEQNAALDVETLSWSELAEAAWGSRDNDRPLAYASFALNHALFGRDLAAYHVVNIGIHLAAGIVVYFLTLVTLSLGVASDQSNDSRRLSRWGALVAAAVFLVHPLQTQAVTYTVQRMTSLAALFYLLALLLYAVGRQQKNRPVRVVLWLVALVSWILALGSKQIAATLPVAILLYELYFFRELSWQRSRRRLAWLLVPAAAVLGVVAAYYVDGDLGSRLERGYALRDFTLGERLMTQPRVVVHYLSLIVFPSPARLSLLHSIETSRSLYEPATAAALLFVITLAAMAVMSARRWRWLSFAIAWFLVHLAIESTVLPLEMIYEHRLYLPLFGFALLGGYGVVRGASWWPRTATGLVVATLLLLATATHLRNDVWRDPIGLWNDVLAKNPHAFPEAAAQRNRAFNNRGRVYARSGDFRRAQRDFSDALAIDPHDLRAIFNRGLAHRALGNLPQARADFSRAIDLAEATANPLTQGYLQRAIVARQLGDYPAALADLARTLELAPRLGEAHRQLAWIRATAPDARYRDGAAATNIARTGCQATGWNSPTWLDVLACARAEAGDFDEAIDFAQRAVELAAPEQSSDYRQRLEAFEARRAFHDG